MASNTKVEDLCLLIQPAEFFREKVSTAIGKHSLKVTEEVEFYLVNLLCGFIESNKNFSSKENNIFETPLAFILKQAMESPVDEQIKIYKNLGDLTLYVSGYFQDYFNRKTFDIHYYISLGINAYANVANLTREKKDRHFSVLYNELAEKFGDFVEVVAEVSDEIQPDRPTNLLAIYDRWTKQPESKRLRTKLEESGISPIWVNTKVSQ